MGTGTLRKADTPTRLEIVLYRLFQIRLGADYPTWVEYDVASGRYVRQGALWRMVWWWPLFLFAGGGPDAWSIVALGVALAIVVVLSRSGRFLWKANRVESATFLRYQRGEITRREYRGQQMPEVGWWVYAVAFSIPVITLFVWLILR